LRGIDAGFVAGIPQASYLQKLGMTADQLSFGCDVVDNDLYTAIPLRSIPSGRKIVIGTAARLVAKKNLSSAMRAFDIVRRNHPEIMLEWRIAGQGPLDEELKQLARELQVPVAFCGFVGYYDMPGFYQQLDLYWQPSVSEPWGLVVNEAMAAGLPIIVSDRCGCSLDLVTASNGWIHKLSQDGIIQCLEQALAERDHWPEQGHASRELIKQWDVSRYSEGLLQACQVALKGAR
jgi:glycosyltransferase involved in cell wall biosynthesis